jgi:hypothetical protein
MTAMKRKGLKLEAPWEKVREKLKKIDFIPADEDLSMGPAKKANGWAIFQKKKK